MNQTPPYRLLLLTALTLLFAGDALAAQVTGFPKSRSAHRTGDPQGRPAPAPSFALPIGIKFGT